MQIQSLPRGALDGRTIYLEGPEAKHIVKVLRHGPGDEVVFSDGEGHFVYARLDRCTGSSVHADIERVEDDPREAGAPWSTLGLALLKGDHFELGLEKVVELGVHRIVPLLADHCVVKWKEKGGERKLDRWRRIAESAMKQAGRSWRPEVTEPLDPLAAIETYGEGAHVVVGDEEETERSVFDLRLPAGDPHFALVGPEGAFSSREKEAIAARGAHVVSLGPFRLRAETAAIALMAALNGGRSHG